jgi:acyl-CoA reductase-like NAD-dependent aldehyde dehydrogenase
VTTFDPSYNGPYPEDDMQLASIFGGTANTSQLRPGEWNPTAQDSTDIGRIIADGVRGTVNKLINTAVGEKYASGQLTATGTRPTGVQGNLMSLALVAGLVYVLAKS